MATDIAPEIYDAIRADFEAGVRGDKSIASKVKKIYAGKGTQNDVASIANRFGVHASNAMKRNLILDALPNKTLYWNIAEKTIKPALMMANDNIVGYARLMMGQVDRQTGLRIGILTGGNPEERIRQVMQKAVNSMTQEQLNNALTDPVITANRKFFDDFQKENARLRDEMGLTETVVRVYDGRGLHNGKDPCQWCIDREGVWSYKDAVQNGVFERHPGCGCRIEFHTENDRRIQTDWTSNQWQEF